MNVLTVAGSDPSSGAGVQGDIKTFASLGVYGLGVVTAVTSQNSSRFFTAEPVPPAMIRSQIRAVLSDFDVDAIKIGMVYDKETITAVHGEIRRAGVPVVLDPVFASTTGGALMKPGAISHFNKLLIPLAYIITPNVPEAEKITGIRIRKLADARKAALKIRSLGAKCVVIKGGHMAGGTVTDLLLEGKKFRTFSQKRLPRETHGGGCVFSAALCANIAKGMAVSASVRAAQQMSFESIMHASKAGRGVAIARQQNPDAIEAGLGQAISKFVAIRGISGHIPEVQTNFVYSRPGPRGIVDILGIEGRIVRAGSSAVVAGSLKYGGSRHVAGAVLEVAKKFPATRSAVNIRYDTGTIRKARVRHLRVAHYERGLEPPESKKREGSTVSWGTRSAISGLSSPPDIIYHTGDLGKEPMILVFGRDPQDVLTKLGKLI